MNMKEIEAALKLVPTFVKMAENDLGEDEHDIPEPLTAEQFEQVEQLITKLSNCLNFVDQTIFPSASEG
jgi:hypothetical protein